MSAPEGRGRRGVHPRRRAAAHPAGQGRGRRGVVGARRPGGVGRDAARGRGPRDLRGDRPRGRRRPLPRVGRAHRRPVPLRDPRLRGDRARPDRRAGRGRRRRRGGVGAVRRRVRPPRSSPGSTSSCATWKCGDPMDFDFTPEEEAFRAELRAFLDDELPDVVEDGVRRRRARHALHPRVLRQARRRAAGSR